LWCSFIELSVTLFTRTKQLACCSHVRFPPSSGLVESS
jgi:hypothetical protein